ncbi:MAG TPA: hypothetical protein VHX14_03375 [Thermoanaerobaculia bacterium]|jgi:hypothetical protein|nr:hypothetical protein [Thermoanaerobaculia bacterium]
MSNAQARISATSIVALAVIIAFFCYQSYVSKREHLLFSTEFRAGTPRTQVVKVLGRPDQEFTGNEMRKYAAPTDPVCLKAAAATLRYSPPTSNGGAYCEVFLDSGNRVVCVQHGLIAY